MAADLLPHQLALSGPQLVAGRTGLEPARGARLRGITTLRGCRSTATLRHVTRTALEGDRGAAATMPSAGRPIPGSCTVASIRNLGSDDLSCGATAPRSQADHERTPIKILKGRSITDRSPPAELKRPRLRRDQLVRRGYARRPRASRTRLTHRLWLSICLDGSLPAKARGGLGRRSTSCIRLFVATANNLGSERQG